MNLKKYFSKTKPNDDLVLLRVAGISYSKDANIYVLFLEEIIPNWTDTKTPPPNARKIPIIVNFFEAQIIPIEIERIKPQIVLIPDVIKELFQTFKLKIKKIVLFDENNYRITNEIFSKLICDNKEKKEIEIKPSDAVALSMRLKIPIYIPNQLLTDINVLLNEKYDVKKMSEMEKLENYTVDDLKSFLDLAIEKEDYENASIIRDEINRKNN